MTTKVPEVSVSNNYSKSKRPGRILTRSTTVAPVTTTTSRRAPSSYATTKSATTIFESSPTTILKQETTILTTFPTSSSSSTTAKQRYHARFNAGAETKAEEQEITPSSNGFSKTASTKPSRGYHSDRKKEKVNVPEKPVQKSNKYFAESQQVFI